MRVAPCLGCEEKIPPDCHVHCEKYKEWKKERDAIRDARAKEQAAIPSLCRKVVKQIYREMKRK